MHVMFQCPHCKEERQRDYRFGAVRLRCSCELVEFPFGSVDAQCLSDLDVAVESLTQKMAAVDVEISS